MSNEINFRGSLSVKISGGAQYRDPSPGGFTDNMAAAKLNGPTPGAVSVSSGGTDISLAQLTAMGGYAFLQNNDAVATIHLGVRDTVTNEFYPFLQIGPLKGYPVNLSSYLLKAEAGTGTFTSRTVLHAVARGAASAVLVVDAFDP